MINIKQLYNVVREWVGDANLIVSVWDKGTYGRVYIKSHGKRQYSAWVDTDGRIDFFAAYFQGTHSLFLSHLREIAQVHGIRLDA